MTVKELVLITALDLKITVTDKNVTYNLDENNCSCPLDNHVVTFVNIEEDELFVICEQLRHNNLTVIEYISDLCFDDLVKVIKEHKVVCEGFPLELRTNSPPNILNSLIKNITHESGANYETTINLYIS